MEDEEGEEGWGNAPVGFVDDGAEHPMGALPGSYQVTGDGAFTYGLPLVGVPGIAGMEPGLSVGYSSQGGNGALGVGFSLQGLSSVARCGKSLVQDGISQTVQMKEEDQLCVDGEPLVVQDGDYGKDGASYRLHREANVKVVEHGDVQAAGTYFTVYAPNGVVREYGRTPDSRMEVTVGPDAEGTAWTVGFKWAMSKVEDRFGNTMTYGYGKRSATLATGSKATFDAEQWLQEVKYGSNETVGVAATGRLVLRWDGRPDVSLSYMTRLGIYQEQTKRLSGVVAVGAGGQEAWHYNFRYAPIPEEDEPAWNWHYQMGEASRRSRLVAMEQCFGDVCVPETTFAWDQGVNEDQGGHGYDYASDGDAMGGLVGRKTPWYEYSQAVVGDVTGDGQAELLLPVLKVSEMEEQGYTNWRMWTMRADEVGDYEDVEGASLGIPIRGFVKYEGGSKGPEGYSPLLPFTPYLGEFDGTRGSEVLSFIPSLDITALNQDAPAGLGGELLWGNEDNPEAQVGIGHPRTFTGIQVVSAKEDGTFEETIAWETSGQPWLYGTFLDIDGDHLTDLVGCVGNRPIHAKGMDEGEGSYARGQLVSVRNIPGQGLDLTQKQALGGDCGYFDMWHSLDLDGNGTTEFLRVEGQHADGHRKTAEELPSRYEAFGYDPRDGGSWHPLVPTLKLDLLQRVRGGFQGKLQFGRSRDVVVDINGDGLDDVLRYALGGTSLPDQWWDDRDTQAYLEDIQQYPSYKEAVIWPEGPDEVPRKKEEGGWLWAYMNTGAGFSGEGWEAKAKAEGGDTVGIPVLRVPWATGMWDVMNSLVMTDDNGDGVLDIFLRDPTTDILTLEEEAQNDRWLLVGQRGYSTPSTSIAWMEGKAERPRYATTYPTTIPSLSDGYMLQQVYEDCEDGIGDFDPYSDDVPEDCGYDYWSAKMVQGFRSVMTRDVTGDGRTDILVRDGKEARWSYFLRKGSYRNDVVVGIRDGKGRSLAVAYGTLQNKLVYADTDHLGEVSYPQRRNQGSETVVRELREDMGLGSREAPVQKTTWYNYYDTVCDGELGCLGPTFRVSATAATDEDGRKVVTTRAERYDHTRDAGANRYLTGGAVEGAQSVKATVPASDHEPEATHVWVAWGQSPRATVATEGGTHRVQTTGTQSKTWEVLSPAKDVDNQTELLLCLVREEACALEASLGKPLTEATAAYSYGDKHGYVTKVEAKEGGETTTTRIRYEHNEDAWILGLPTYKQGTHAGPFGEQTRTMDYVPNLTNGTLQSVTREPSDATYRTTVKTTYDGFGHETKTEVFDAEGKLKTSAEVVWSADGRFPETTKNALGHPSHVVWDKMYGLPLQATDATGTSAVMHYDALGRPTKQQAYHGAEALGPSTEFLYEGPLDATDAYQVTTLWKGTPSSTVEYDRMDRAVATTWEGPFETLWGQRVRYDAQGRLVDVTVPHKVGEEPSGVTHYTYDGLSRVVEMMAPTLLPLRTMRYAGHTQEVEDYLGRVRRETYDGLGRLATYTEGLGFGNEEPVAMCLEYGAFASLTKVRPCTADARKAPVEYTYDLYGNRTRTYDPALGERRYFYNSLSELERYEDSNGNAMTYHYDALGRPTLKVVEAVDEAQSEEVTWSYDDQVPGALDEGMSTTNHGMRVTYDGMGRVKAMASVVQGQDYTYEVLYDQAEKLRPKAIFYPQGDAQKAEGVPRVSVVPQYDERGFLRSVHEGTGLLDDEGNPTDELPLLWEMLEQDKWGHITKEWLGNGVQTVRQYDPYLGKLEKLTTTDEIFPTQTTIQDLRYTYWASGEVFERIDKVHGQLFGQPVEQKDVLDYDSLGRLTTAWTQLGPTPAHKVGTTYDPFGNILTRDGVGIYHYEGERLKTITGPKWNAKFWYDANGNRIAEVVNGVNRAYGYNARNQVIRMVSLPELDVESQFGPGGDKVWEHDHALGLTTVMAGGLYERSQTSGEEGFSEVYRLMGPQGVVAEKTRQYESDHDPTPNASTRYFHKEGLGSIDVVTDEQGHILEQQSYDGYGRERNPHNWLMEAVESQDTTVPIRLGYTGHERTRSGVVDMKGRSFDARMGGMLQADPVQPEMAPGSSQALNRYSYVLNSPLNATDPSGFAPAGNWYPDESGLEAALPPDMGGETGGGEFSGAGGGGYPTEDLSWVHEEESASNESHREETLPGGPVVAVGQMGLGLGQWVEDCKNSHGSYLAVGGCAMNDMAAQAKDMHGAVEAVYDDVLRLKVPDGEKLKKGGLAILGAALLGFEMGWELPGRRGGGMPRASATPPGGRGGGGRPPGGGDDELWARIRQNTDAGDIRLNNVRGPSWDPFDDIGGNGMPLRARELGLDELGVFGNSPIGTLHHGRIASPNGEIDVIRVNITRMPETYDEVLMMVAAAGRVREIPNSMVRIEIPMSSYPDAIHFRDLFPVLFRELGLYSQIPRVTIGYRPFRPTRNGRELPPGVFMDQPTLIINF